MSRRYRPGTQVELASRAPGNEYATTPLHYSTADKRAWRREQARITARQKGEKRGA